jgi:superfamily II DNA/RNA helicase
MPILALHGKQQQMKRVEVYNDFIKKKNAVLFATDIAARGLGTNTSAAYSTDCLDVSSQ